MTGGVVNGVYFIACSIDAAFTVKLDTITCNANTFSGPNGSLIGIIGSVLSFNFFTIKTQSITIDAFYFTNNQSTASAVSIAGILLYAINNCLVSKAIVTNNSSLQYGIVAENQDNLAIRSCYIADNSSDTLTGIVSASVTNAIIDQCIIAKNTAATGFIGLNCSQTLVNLRLPWKII